MFSRIATYLPTAFLAALVVYFGFQALTGERGLLTAHERRAELTERQAEYARAHARRMELETRARLLRTDSLSADLLEERAKALLGFSDPRDYVIRMDPPRG